MRIYKIGRRHGFTLIELMVVVAIIALLAALIVPALQKAQTTAASRSCMSKIRGIPAVIRTYTASWGGWTHPSKEYYIKLFDFKLSSDANFTTVDRSNQAQASDLICPVDGAPSSTDHGVRTSYRVAGDFVGANIMNFTGAANRILAGIERGKRHPKPNSLTGELEGHYSYADGSASLGYDGPALPGIVVRIYNSASDTAFQLPEEELPTPVDETTVSAGTHFTTGSQWTAMAAANEAAVADWSWDPAAPTTNQNRINNNDLNHTNTIKNFLWRFDTIVQFPQAGDWILGGYALHHSHSGLAVSTAGAAAANKVEPLGSWTQASHHGNSNRGIERNRLGGDGHANARYHRRSVDGALPFYKLAMFVRTTTGEFPVSLYGGLGVSWFLSDPNDPRSSIVGSQNHGQPIPMSSLFRLP